MHNDRGQQAQPGCPEVLIFERAVAERASVVKEHGSALRIAGVALSQPRMAALAQRRVGQPPQDEQRPFDAPKARSVRNKALYGLVAASFRRT